MSIWSKKKAWDWYNSNPWIRGANFMCSESANRVDEWQSFGFEKRFEQTEQELKLLKDTGFNAIRIIVEFIVWHKEHDSFLEKLERYIATAFKYGIKSMIVFGNDCMPPTKEELDKRITLGEQPFDIGYHGGRKVSQHGTFSNIGVSLLDDENLAPLHYEMVREIITKYKDDERVLIWDLFNEPGNSNRKDKSLPHIQKFFEIAREINPIQPLTSGVWSNLKNLKKLSKIEKFALKNSDIITYHDYSCFETSVIILKNLLSLGRPVVCTEWLARCMDNTVFNMFPLFYLEKVGCFNWGFVAGKYQTFEPWNSVWSSYEKNPDIKFDFTKWFHDLYRPSFRPYDPKEIELIKRFCDLADKEKK